MEERSDYDYQITEEKDVEKILCVSDSSPSENKTGRSDGPIENKILRSI